jgi:acyl carrier protein
MTAMLTQAEIYRRVSTTIADALAVDPDFLKPNTTLQTDLGAESIDLLDIVFRLECEFGFEIPRGELFPDSLFERNPEFVQDGMVTQKGAARLGVSVGHIGELLTVDLISRYIQDRLAEENTFAEEKAGRTHRARARHKSHRTRRTRTQNSI